MHNKSESIESGGPAQPATDQRLHDIRLWLESELEMSDYRMEVASADASFRRYFRLISEGRSWIIMDAPPDREDCAPFVRLARLIEAAGVQSPHIFRFNEAQGFMQLSDLGSTAYLDKLNHETVDSLYGDAIDTIIKMQGIQADLPDYDTELLQNEMQLFSDWYLQTHLGLTLSSAQRAILRNTFELLTDNALQQPVVFVHRDYHSRNLMITRDNNPGVIDFQDAVNGPCSYDLVSLIKDCYIAWPRQKQLQWIQRYLELSACETEPRTFIKQLDLMGMQRHLKATGIFARLNHRDAKPGYLKDIPRTLAYVFDVCDRYAELQDFSTMLMDMGISADKDTRQLIK